MIERSAAEGDREAYRTIGEVAEEFQLPQHVLRFWETRFPEIKPLKRAGGRRFYGSDDLALLRAVKALLYGEGYTIKGVQRLLQEQGSRAVAAALVDPVHPSDAERVGDRDREVDAAGPASGSVGVAGRTGDDDARPIRGSAMQRPARAPVFRPDATAAPSGPVDARVLERLAALALDLADCARVLAAARALRD